MRLARGDEKRTGLEGNRGNGSRSNRLTHWLLDIILAQTDVALSSLWLALTIEKVISGCT